jgi:hypothetical protein
LLLLSLSLLPLLLLQSAMCGRLWMHISPLIDSTCAHTPATMPAAATVGNATQVAKWLRSEDRGLSPPPPKHTHRAFRRSLLCASQQEPLLFCVQAGFKPPMLL